MMRRKIACAHSGWIYNVIGFPEKSLEQIHAAVEWSEELGHPSSTSEALTFASHVYNNRNEFSKSAYFSRWLLKLSEDHGFPFRIVVAKTILGRALAGQGKMEEGIREIIEGLDVMKSLDTDSFLTLHMGLLADVYWLGRRSKKWNDYCREGA